MTTTLTYQEIKQLVDKMDQFADNITEINSLEFLINAGICDKNGNLTENYK